MSENKLAIDLIWDRPINIELEIFNKYCTERKSKVDKYYLITYNWDFISMGKISEDIIFSLQQSVGEDYEKKFIRQGYEE